MSQIKLKFDTTPKTSRGGKILRIALLLVFLLLVGYFVASSSWFLQSVVVPRVGAALNSNLTLGDLELRPFSEINLTQVKLTPVGADTLFEAKRIQVRYNLLAILRGNIRVDEVLVDTPTITIVQNARGASNLDALGGSSDGRQPATKAGAPPRLDLKFVTLRNATLRHTRTFYNGNKVTTELANFNLSVKNIKNGGNGTLTLSAALAMEKTTTTPPGKASLPALFNGDLTFGLHEDLQLGSVKGMASFSVGRATGEFAELSGLIARLDCEMSPAQIKEFALQFNKGSATLGGVRVSGPFDTIKTEGELKLELLAIDRQVLNLFGAPRGIDFGTTTINGATDITIAKAGRMISLAGRMDVARLQIIQKGQASPALDLTCNYDLTVDRVGKSLLLKSINLSGTQNQRVLIAAALSNPLTLAFGDTVNAADASLDFSVTALNLADWRALAPGLDLAGTANVKGRLFSRDGGKRVSLEFEKRIKGFSARLGGGPTTVEDISFNGALNHTAQGETLNSTLTLAGIKLAGVPGHPLQVSVNVDAAVSNQVVELRQCNLKLTPTARAKNELGLTGRVNLSDPGALAGNLKLAAESLDVTGYYDLFAANPATDKTTTAPPPTPARTSNVEPAPVKLPFAKLTLEANIGRLYLHEVDAANFVTTLQLSDSQVVLQPFQLTLNNAPVSATADLDLSAPGYKYALTFSADGVPVEPLANTFSPTYRGQAKGTLIAKLDLKGAGVTGRNLRTNLTGTVDLNFTNANIQIVGPKLKAVLGSVALVLSSLGAPDLMSSPLDHITASLRAGEGKITVPAFIIQSPLFRANSTGAIPIADDLMDSPLNQPVEISLARELAAKLGISNVPANETYAKLPTFVQITGTLGKPTAKTDKSQLASLVTSGIGSAILKNVGGERGQQIGGALNALGGLLGGKPAATNAAPDASTTNAASTNSPTKPSLKDALRSLTK